MCSSHTWSEPSMICMTLASRKNRPARLSPAHPADPSSCTASLLEDAAARAAAYFAMTVVATAPGSPASRARLAARHSWRAEVASTAIPASIDRTNSCSASATEPCRRRTTCAAVSATQAAAMPAQPQATVKRPWSSAVATTCDSPKPGRATRLPAGTRTRSKVTCAIMAARRPSCPDTGSVVTPARSASTSTVAARPSSLPSTRNTVASWPKVTQRFSPVTVITSPARSSRVSTADSSVPAPGSVAAKPASCSPDASAGSQSARCSAVPQRAIAADTMPCTVTSPRTELHTALFSTHRPPRSAWEPPRPPYRAGRSVPNHPALATASRTSTGSTPRSSQSAASSSLGRICAGRLAEHERGQPVHRAEVVQVEVLRRDRDPEPVLHEGHQLQRRQRVEQAPLEVVLVQAGLGTDQRADELEQLTAHLVGLDPGLHPFLLQVVRFGVVAHVLDEQQAPGRHRAGVDHHRPGAGRQLAAGDGGGQVEQDVVGPEVAVGHEVLRAGAGEPDAEHLLGEPERPGRQVLAEMTVHVGGGHPVAGEQFAVQLPQPQPALHGELEGVPPRVGALLAPVPLGQVPEPHRVQVPVVTVGGLHHVEHPQRAGSGQQHGLPAVTADGDRMPVPPRGGRPAAVHHEHLLQRGIRGEQPTCGEQGGGDRDTAETADREGERVAEAEQRLQPGGLRAHQPLGGP